jgi:FkbM family methyltransferase
MIFNKLRYLTSKYQFLRALFLPFINIRHLILINKRSKLSLIVRNIRGLMVNDPVFAVTEFKGEFFLNRNSDLFARLITEKNYEPELAALCQIYIDKKRDVIDVGANIGFFTVLFAKTITTGKVFSIEPTRNALNYLYRNLEINGVMDKVEVFEGVVSNKNGIVQIKTVFGKEEYSSLGVMKHPSLKNEVYDVHDVMSITIDDLVKTRSIDPGFIKIDVEGVEYAVLDGMRTILRNSRPIIVLELSDFLLKQNGSSAKATIDLLEEYEYDVYDPLDSDIKPGWKRSGDIICFPRELLINFKT